MSDLTPLLSSLNLTPLLSFCDFDVRYATCRTVLCFHHDY